jgi:hypothetical protein
MLCDSERFRPLFSRLKDLAAAPRAKSSSRNALQPQLEMTMKKETKNGWTHHGHDTLLNGAVLAAGVLGLFLAVLDAPVRQAGPLTASVVLGEDMA